MYGGMPSMNTMNRNMMFNPMNPMGMPIMNMPNQSNPYAQMVVDPPRQSVLYPKDNFLKEEECNVYTLMKEEELRIELSKGESIRLIVESGHVEIEGAELPLNYALTYTHTKFAIFCWSESKIKVEGNPTSIYTSESNKNTMNQYLLAHCLINERREASLMKNKIGPSVMVIGAKESGTSTLCHFLLNNSLKLGWTPMYVDLDLSNEIAVPGTIAATPVDFPLPNDYSLDSALILFNGHLINDLNLYLYEKQINELAYNVKAKIECDLNSFKKKYNLKQEKNANKSAKFSDDSDSEDGESFFVNNPHPTLFASGMVIHCPMVPSSKDNSIYKTFIDEFQVDIVFVIENEKLYNVMKNINEKHYVQQSDRAIDVCLLYKTQGINQEPIFKEYLEQRKFDVYFKGPFNNLKITEFKIDLNKYKLLHIIFSNVTSEWLPIGMTSDLNILLMEVNLEENLLNRVLSIVHLEDKVINDLDANFDKNLNLHVEKFARAPVSFLAYM